MTVSRILVFAPDLGQRRTIERVLRARDRDPYFVSTVAAFTAAVVDVRPVAVLLLVERPLLIIEVVRESRLPVIALVETNAMSEAVALMRAGATDVVLRTDRRAVYGALERAEAENMASPSASLPTETDRYGFGKLMSQSPRMVEVFDRIRSVAQTDATVLVRGETGTGKELISRAIHMRSKRKDSPMISVNCGAFPETLLESELFGHERGSFTGASAQREGVFEMADGGTLFLDELGETSPNVQVSLLRVLEDFQFRRVGGREQVHADVRIVAATHVHLEAAVEKGDFRQDLFYRLNVFPIDLPPLRERAEDIPLLMRIFLEEFAESYALDVPVVSAEALQSILAYRWPGNIRQLRAMCERWVIVRGGERLEPSDLPTSMTDVRTGPAPGMLTIQDDLTMKANTTRVVEQLERAYLYRQLRRHQGHLARTAEAAGITRRTLYTKMKQFQLDAGDFRVKGEAP